MIRCRTMSTTPAAPAAPAAVKAENMKKKRIYQLIMAIAGTVLTQLAWNPTKLFGYAGISNIIASASLGLIAGVLFKKHFDIFYAGTFAGMCSAAVLPNVGWAFLLGLFVFVFWVLLEKKFIGVGGKFGTTAMVSGLATSLIILIATPGYPYPLFNGALYGQVSEWILWVFGPIAGAIGCAATLYVRNKGELVKNTTVASAMIGLLGASFLLLITATTPPSTGTTTVATYGTVLAGIVYTASFAGMASKERLDTCKVYSEYVAFAITGAIAGVLFMAIYGFMLVGGRFGFIGFCSVLIYNKLICKFLKARQAKAKPAPPVNA